MSSAAMLTEVELKNYRGHTDTKVPLARFTLLVGDNAVGKTSVLESVSLVAQKTWCRRSHRTALDWRPCSSTSRRPTTVEEAARAVVPSLIAMNFRRVQKTVLTTRVMTVDGQKVTVPEQSNVISDELLLKFTDTDWLPAHAAREGTLLTLGVLTRLYEPAAPRVLLLDDIDRALHPRAQGEFIARLRTALDALPGTQVIATAHSPYLADCTAPKTCSQRGLGTSARSCRGRARVPMATRPVG